MYENIKYVTVGGDFDSSLIATVIVVGLSKVFRSLLLVM